MNTKGTTLNPENLGILGHLEPPKGVKRIAGLTQMYAMEELAKDREGVIYIPGDNALIQ